MYRGGAMGGANPLTSLSQAVFPPQEGVPWAWAGLEAGRGTIPKGATQRGNPLGGRIHSREGSQGVIVHPSGWFP